jgi:TusA-related sulfurtransferase
MSEASTQDGVPHDTFASGLDICYEVLLYLSNRLSRLERGQVLAFVTSDPEATDKIPAWCDVRGYTLLASQVLPDRRQRFLIRK